MGANCTLYMGGTFGGERVFVDVPVPCWSKLDAIRRFKERQDRYRARGCGVWFARVEDGSGVEWLADHRGLLRRGG